MELDLVEVINNNDFILPVQCDLQIGSVEFNGEWLVFLQPVHIDGNISNKGDHLCFNAQAIGKVIVRCCRCMKEIEEEFSLFISENLISAQSSVEDLDTYQLNGTKLELDNIVINNILLGMPMKHLCGEKCKGLCSFCGSDLNVNPCQCQVDEIDPRLAVLKKFNQQ